MAGPTKTLRLDNFTGGVNLRDDPVDLAVNECSKLLDWTPLGRGGAIVQRPGDTHLVDLTAHGTPLILSIYHHNLDVVLVLLTNGRVRTIDPDTGLTTTVRNATTNPSINIAAVEAPASGGQGPLYTILSDTVVPTSPTPFQWNGAALNPWTTTLGAVPPVGQLIYAGNRVWAGTPFVLGGVSAANDSRLWFTDLADPRSWPAANTLQLDPGDGEQPTALVPFGNLIIVFKRHKIWRIYDLDSGANERIAADVGVPNFGTPGGGTTLAVASAQGVVFIDENRGPMLTDGVSVKELPNGSKVGETQWRAFTRLTYHDEHVYAVCNDGLIYDYDFRTQGWWQINYDALDVIAASDRLLAAPSTALRVDRLLDAGVDTSPIRAELVLPPFGFGLEGKHKRFRQMRLNLAGHVEIGVRRDYASAAGDETLFNGPGGGGNALGQLILPGFGVARALAVRVSGSNDPVAGVGYTPPQLDAIEIDYQQRAR